VAIMFSDQSRIGIGNATTIVVGHLAVQIFVMRINAERTGRNSDVQPKLDNWHRMLVPIWPIGRQSVMWPAEVTFTGSGSRSIATLMDRGRIGESVPSTPTA
jgi:hypothetical protein